MVSNIITVRLITSEVLTPLLRRAANTADGGHQWRHGLSALVAGSRGAALLAERALNPGLAASDEVALAVLVVAGAVRCEDLAALGL